MHARGQGRATVVARVCALSAASVVLGVAAHASMSTGAIPPLGPLLVEAQLVVLLVAGIALGGRAVGRLVRSVRWAERVEDSGALLALLGGQVLVHWMGSPVDTHVPVGHGHGGHALMTSATVLMPETAHTPGGGMFAAHASAAVMVGVLLRRLELGLLGVSACLLRGVERAHALVWPSRQGHGLVAVMERSPGARLLRWLCRVDPLGLRAIRATVVRRGPPMRMTLA